MKTVLLGNQLDTHQYVPLSFTALEDEMSLIHHDLRDLDEDGTMLYATTRYGLTVFDYDQMVSFDHWMPQGVELHESLLLSLEDSSFALAIATSIGLAVAPLQADGNLGPLATWDWSLSDEIFALTLLNFDGQNQYIIGLGQSGEGAVFEVTTSSEIAQNYELASGLYTALSQSEATVTGIAHGPAGGGNNTLYVGTDRGLLFGETSTARGAFEATWRFYYTPEVTPYPTAIDELRSLSLGMIANPANVRTMTLAGPTQSNAQVLWFGTPSGVHRMNLVDNSISYGGLLEHPGVDGKYVRELQQRPLPSHNWG